MKIYLAYLLLITGALWMTTPMATVANSNPAAMSTTTISPTAALERLIIAKKLEADWFTPAFIKGVGDVSTIQFQRDVSLKLGTMRYGNYKSVRSIGGDKYRIIFDRAEPDAVIAQFRIDAMGRIAGIRLVEKNKLDPNTPEASAQVTTNLAVSFDRLN
ncbi:hypothetical protein [Chamaesiphon sp.]|uniref:hypothetical protein n=1 Tax=Chamaesiphon sp. TaxID=2814140 RepID=UPI0035945440